MRRIIAIFIALAIISEPGNAQDSFTDSVLHVISKTPENKQAELYAMISNKWLGKDYDKALFYARRALAIARKNKNAYAITDAYTYIADIYDHTGRIEDGIKVCDTALIYAQKANDNYLKFWIEYRYANLYRRLADYNNAIEHGLNAVKIAEQSSDKPLAANAYNTVGIIYVTLNELDEAEKYYNKSIAIRTAINDIDGLSTVLNNIGILYRQKGNYHKAIEYYIEALNMVKQLDNPSRVAFLYNDIGAAYSFIGNTKKAREYLQTSIDMRESLNELDEIAYTYNYMGENYERSGDVTNGEKYIKKALATAIRIGNNKQHYEALESLSDFYSRNNMYDSAYTYLKKYRLYRDSLKHLENKEYIAQLQTEYETEKKEQQIALQQTELKSKNYIIGGITGVLLLGGLLSYSYYRRYRLAQHAKLQQAILKEQELATQAVLEAEEKERQRIAGDLHDGVGQLMSAARMNLSLIENEIDFEDAGKRAAFDKALALVDDSCKEVRAVSHNIMPNALLKAGLVSAIREFIQKIDQRALEVTLYTDGINNRLPSNVESVLYRVIQECVNNVIKHSGANKLDITLIKDEDGISITIEDNGKGFDTKIESDGIGLKNMQTRIHFLKGNIEWDSAPGKGTVVSIQVPPEGA